MIPMMIPSWTGLVEGLSDPEMMTMISSLTGEAVVVGRVHTLTS
jgi:hypothetical protein